MERFVQCIDSNDLDGIEENHILTEAFELRFGNEFCFKKCLPDDKLDEAMNLAERHGKRVSFIYPRLNDDEINQVKHQLCKINEYNLPVYIIANDLGISQLIKSLSLKNLKVILGRQTISVPMRARPAMPSVMDKDSIISDFADKKLFHLSNLNYKLTLKYIKSNDIYGLEFDYIPETFPLIKKLQKEGMYIYVHKGNVMVALTRKCHTKRLVCEEGENCKLACKNKKFKLFHEVTDELFMDGNAILAAIPYNEDDIRELNNEMVSIVDSHKWIEEYNK
ncbi:hypothetical protein EDD76_108162 [Kineothrix alysoides]|uniref:Collagenase-like PrtC family protease n=1 Tax=Kineothrix alysoides TaxID=1469948 RepID=A0A4R1QVL2_9FIRM|nr:hypothetical protein [Kineothrix alysoides]TCL57627.1 hypothetical protein EDD76_108162 [Kineothrix alysoides]